MIEAPSGRIRKGTLLFCLFSSLALRCLEGCVDFVPLCISENDANSSARTLVVAKSKSTALKNLMIRRSREENECYIAGYTGSVALYDGQSSSCFSRQRARRDYVHSPGEPLENVLVQSFSIIIDIVYPSTECGDWCLFCLRLGQLHRIVVRMFMVGS